ncbi:MAG: PAS domain S-box protein [Deltaproteobacteria bacterium]|nr:PAS domain S-box protein [Deltaproteobacteria bacterium]
MEDRRNVNPVRKDVVDKDLDDVPHNAMSSDLSNKVNTAKKPAPMPLQDRSGVSSDSQAGSLTYNSADLLSIAFDTFKKASETLEKQYAVLEKRVEALNLELEEKNKYLDGILQNLPVGVVAIDLDAQILSMNKTAQDILGDSNNILNSLNSNKITDIISFLPYNYFNDNKFGPISEIEGELVKRGNAKSIIINAAPMKDTKEKLHGWLVILKDNTELKRLKESAERNKRLAAMGEMAASIAHQIRNPLGSIELFASVLRDELSGDAEKSNLAAHISTAVSTLNNILSNMLFFANQSMPVFAPVSVNKILDETLAFAEYLKKGKNGIVIERLYQTKDVEFFGDSELLKQAFLNIVANAIQSMDENGRLAIDIEIQGSRVKGQGSEGVADCLKISFSDTGLGIPDEVIDRIFDPFFTTKERGTGLGLAIVNNIIKAHEGVIEVESKKGVGTRIDIILPVPVNNGGI